jgi:hypothetical protein
VIYAIYLGRLIGFRFGALMTVYARSGLCALAAGVPLMIARWQGVELGLIALLVLSAAGVLAWLAALAATRHPAWREVRMMAEALSRPILSRRVG